MSDLKKGRDILADQVTTEPGVSDVGIAIRRGDERNQGVVSHGYARVTDPKSHKQHAKRYLGALVDAMKKQPKPNLPKSESSVVIPKQEFVAEHKKLVDVLAHPTKEKLQEERKDQSKELRDMKKTQLTKADIEQFDEVLRKDNILNHIKALRAQKESQRQKKLEEHFGAKGQAVPEHLKQPAQAPHLDYKKLRTEFQAKNTPLAEMKERAAQAKKPIAKPAPAPDRYSKMHDPDKSGKVNYNKPAEAKPAAPSPIKFTPKLKVAKAEGKKVSIDPVDVSAPVIENRGTVSAPAKISGPAVMSPVRDEKLKKCGTHLKRLIGSLKKVDPKTRLPGNLINKTDKAK